MIAWRVEARSAPRGHILYEAEVDVTEGSGPLAAEMWGRLQRARAEVRSLGGIVFVMLRRGDVSYGPWPATISYPRAAIHKLQDLRTKEVSA